MKSEIDGLVWDRRKTEIAWDPGVPATHLSVTIHGVYDKRFSALIWKDQEIKRDRDGRFQLRAPVTANPERIELAAVAPDGKIERQSLDVSIPDWDLLKTYPRLASKRFHFTADLQDSFISYQDIRVPKYSENALTAGGSLAYFFYPSRWDAEAGVSFSLAPLSKNSSVTARLLDMYARVGYSLGELNSRLRLKLYGGVYYVTFFAFPNQFGYQNMAGPQIAPVLKYDIDARDRALAYLKFALVSSGFRILSAGSHEVGFGLSYLRSFRGGYSLGPALDVAFQDLMIQGYVFSSSEVSFGLRFGY